MSENVHPARLQDALNAALENLVYVQAHWPGDGRRTVGPIADMVRARLHALRGMQRREGGVMPEPRIRSITGVQLHHRVLLTDASEGLANASAGLRGAITCTGRADYQDALTVLEGCARLIGRMEREASQEMADLHAEDPERFVRCRDGAERWPSHTIGGFQARCTCYDVCQRHENGRPEPGWTCRCAPCPAHPDEPLRERRAA